MGYATAPHHPSHLKLIKVTLRTFLRNVLKTKSNVDIGIHLI